MIGVVTRELLQAFIAKAPSLDALPLGPPAASHIDLERVLADSGITVHRRKVEPDGRVIFEVDCMTSHTHQDGAFFTSMPSGAVAYGCLHDSCAGKVWHDVKPMLTFSPEPTARGRQAGAQSERDDRPAVGLKLRRASEIEPRDIEWLWQGWLPFGMVTLFAGHGGTGKSSAALAVAAACSVGGKLPDGTNAPRAKTLLLAAEDSPEYTIVPRLKALGADSGSVLIVDGIVRDNDEPGWVQLRDDMPLIKDTVRSESIGLVIIDPISSYIGDANGDKESDVRTALMPLVNMAEQTGVAVLVIRHVSKTGDGYRAASRILGSTAWHDVPRVAWMLADAPQDQQPDPNEDGTRDVLRVLGVVKSNIAVKPPARIGVQPAEGPFRWLEESSPVTVEECFNTPQYSGSKSRDAQEWLKEYLAGGSQSATSVEHAAKEAGISKRTLDRARAALNVKSRRDADGWWLTLPPQLGKPDDEDLKASKDVNAIKDDTLGILPRLTKDATSVPVALFPDPRGKSGGSSSVGENDVGCRESKDVKKAVYREVGTLPDHLLPVKVEWSMDL